MEPSAPPPAKRWQFWIDRGGTFTNIVGRRHRATGLQVFDVVSMLHGRMAPLGYHSRR